MIVGSAVVIYSFLKLVYIGEMSAAKAPMPGKLALRSNIKKALRLLSAETIAAQSAAVTEQLFACDLVARRLCKPGGLVCSYLPMRREVSPDATTQRLLAEGQRVLVPRVTGSASADMVILPIHSWSEVQDFPTNQWGIPEPLLPDGGGDGQQGELKHLAAVKLVLVPGLAFDGSCARLGRGKGYYDAFFARLRAVCTPMPLLVGLSLSEQCVPSVPVEPHDVLLDAVVTPTGVLMSSRRVVVGE